MFRVVERSKLSLKFGNETFMDCHLSEEEEDAAVAETRTILLDVTFPPPNLSFENSNKVDEKRERLLLFVVVVVLLEITMFFLVDVDDDFEDDFDDDDDFEENTTGGFVTAANILNKKNR